MKTGTGTVIGAGIGAATGLIGMLGQRKREKRAVENQKTLMDWQKKNQRELNQQGADLQYDMWKKTNYPAQMEMMKEAGLNTSLMYGMSGGGGTTAGSQGGGSASGGQAPAPQPMELGTAMQAAMTAANIKLAESQAKKNEAEAESIRGEEGTVGASQIGKLIAETKTEEEKKHLILAQNRLATTQAALAAGQTDKVYQEIDNLQEQLRGIEMNNDIIEATKDVQIDAIGAELMNTLSKTKLQDEQARQIWHSILQQWVAQGMKGLDIIVKGRLGDIGKAANSSWRKGFQEGVNNTK